MHLRWRISKYFSLVHVSHVSFCQHHLPWFCWQKCIWNGFRQIMTKVSSNSSSTILSAVVCLKSDNENWSSPHKCYIFHISVPIISLIHYLSSPCFCPINWWIKSSPPGVVFTNFTKSTAVPTTLGVKIKSFIQPDWPRGGHFLAWLHQFVEYFAHFFLIIKNFDPQN